MTELIPTHAWSFLRGRSRDAEHALWGQYALAAPALDGVALHNRIEVVVATMFDILGIEQLLRPVPFPLHIPWNQLVWPAEVDPEVVVTAGEWAQDLLTQLFGPVTAPLATVADGLVIVDGHNLPPATLAELAERMTDLPGLLLLPPGVPVPVQLRPLHAAGRLDVVPVGGPNPVTPAEVEACCVTAGWRSLLVAGSGPRLLPAIVGLCDMLLFQAGGTQEQPYAVRRDLCRAHIHVVAGASLFPPLLAPQPESRSAGLRRYLGQWVVTAERVQQDARFPMLGPIADAGLRITPLLLVR